VEKNGPNTSPYRGPENLTASVRLGIEPFGPQNGSVSSKATKREKYEDWVAERIEFELVVPFALPKGITPCGFGEERCDLLRALQYAWSEPLDGKWSIE